MEDTQRTRCPSSGSGSNNNHHHHAVSFAATNGNGSLGPLAFSPAAAKRLSTRCLRAVSLKRGGSSNGRSKRQQQRSRSLCDGADADAKNNNHAKCCLPPIAALLELKGKSRAEAEEEREAAKIIDRKEGEEIRKQKTDPFKYR